MPPLFPHLGLILSTGFAYIHSFDNSDRVDIIYRVHNIYSVDNIDIFYRVDDIYRVFNS